MSTQRSLVPALVGLVLAALLLASAAGTQALAASCSTAADLRALRALQRPPFAPTDVGLFTPQVYPDAPVMEPAPFYVVSEAGLRRRLRNILSRRFRNDRAEVTAGLAVFDDAQLTALIPQPQLRMALALLKGTAGEAAIAGIRSGVYDEVRFASGLPDYFIAGVLTPAGASRPSVYFNERHQFEDPRALAPILAHETFHQDAVVENKEELTAAAIEALIHAQMLLEAPPLALTRTELSRSANTRLMARLNSRDARSRLRLFQAQGDIFPGGVAGANFAVGWGDLSEDTPGNPTMARMLRAVTGRRAVAPDFDDATLRLLDRRQQLLCPVELKQIARILRLDLKSSSSPQALRSS